MAEQGIAVARRAQESVVAFRGGPECASGPQEHQAYGGSITVCIRVRPVSEEERGQTGISTHSGNDDRRDTHEFESVSTCNPVVFHHMLGAGDKVDVKQFKYHHVFGDTSSAVPSVPSPYETSNDLVYASLVRDLVARLKNRISSTVIAYGQTGAGKTYTQTAMQDRLACDLFKCQAGEDEALPRSTITVSFFENQGDRIFDLQNGRNELPIREDAEGHIHVVDLVSREAGSAAELQALLLAANSLRASEPTQNNPHSSRSHAVCEFRCSKNPEALLRIVDLAGCERRQDVSEHSYERIQEMKDINWSLGCLKECIRMQREAELKQAKGGKAAAAHVPYRRSKLTMLLKECFTDAGRESGGKTVFIGHVAPMTSSNGYTKSTLLYAQELLALSEGAAKPPPGAVVLPEKWSKLRFAKWLEKVDGGRYAQLVESFQITGATFKHMPPGNQAGGLVPRVVAAGGSEEDAQALLEAFRKETAKSKKAQAAAAKST